jgi:hypothetical protein
MSRPRFAVLRIAVLAVASIGAFASTPSYAVPTKCISESWAYAFYMTGSHEQTPEWQAYAAEYQDANGCAVAPTCIPNGDGTCYDPVYD